MIKLPSSALPKPRAVGDSPAQEGASSARRVTAGLLVALAILAVAAWALPQWYFHAGQPFDRSWLRAAMLALSLLTLYRLLLAVGTGVTGRRAGVLWSSRNTYSLSRLQLVLWTWLVLSGLLGVVICRAWRLFDGGGLESALDIHMPTQLLTVMGISVASSAAAPAILSMKAQAAGPSQTALDAAARRIDADVHAVGSVYVRPGVCPPLVKDLFQSDDATAAGTVDISKVQQFAVTFILWAVYLAMLMQLMLTGRNGPVPANAVPGTTGLPALSESFVYLLGISHAGYLAYKAAPTTQPAGATAPGTATPDVPSAVLPRPQPPDPAS